MYVQDVRQPHSILSIRSNEGIVNPESAAALDISADAKTESVAPAVLKSERTDTDGNKLSEDQQAYFADSKVRDAEGKLQVMYRGDSADVNVFDRKKSRPSNLYGRGFYFTSSKSHAGQYGDARAFYLNIKNPLRPNQNSITREQMLKFLQAIEEDGEDYDLYNYGENATANSVLKLVWGKGNFEMLQDVSASAIGDLVAAVELFNSINGTDYDGFILPTETVVFQSEQAKLTTNKTPTSNPNILLSARKNIKTFKNGQNAKGEFVVDVLIDLDDTNSEWWTGRYNRAILGMSKTDDTEFRQFYQEILKRTKDMDEYGVTVQQPIRDTFTVSNGKGKEFIYVVEMDGYLHGVVFQKIDKARYQGYAKKYEGSKKNGRSDADTIRRVSRARSDLGRKDPGNSRRERPNGNIGSSRMAGNEPGMLQAEDDRRESSIDQGVSNSAAKSAERKNSEREVDATSTRYILTNALEGVAQNEWEQNKLNEYKENIAKVEEMESRLQEINSQLYPYGKKMPQKERIALQDEAVGLRNKITNIDKKLLRL